MSEVGIAKPYDKDFGNMIRWLRANNAYAVTDRKGHSEIIAREPKRRPMLVKKDGP